MANVAVHTASAAPARYHANVINLLNRVPEKDCPTFFHTTQNKM